MMGLHVLDTIVIEDFTTAEVHGGSIIHHFPAIGELGKAIVDSACPRLFLFISCQSSLEDKSHVPRGSKSWKHEACASNLRIWKRQKNKQKKKTSQRNDRLVLPTCITVFGGSAEKVVP
jgi:hypothetical protein